MKFSIQITMNKNLSIVNYKLKKKKKLENKKDTVKAQQNDYKALQLPLP